MLLQRCKDKNYFSQITFFEKVDTGKNQKPSYFFYEIGDKKKGKQNINPVEIPFFRMQFLLKLCT
jgi:hypothetical protein